jgi:hypothetical protein
VQPSFAVRNAAWITGHTRSLVDDSSQVHERSGQALGTRPTL